MSARGATVRTFLLGGLMIAAACMEVSGPHAAQRLALNVYPVFDVQAGGGAGDADSFVIVISNPPFPDDTIKRKIEAGQDTIQITVQTEVSSSGADTISVGFGGFSSLSGLQLYAGTATITVFAGAPSASAPVPASYVGPGANIKTLALAPHTVAFSIGGTAQLSVTATDSANAAMAPDSVPVVFITRNASVASVDGAGLATAKANGSTWVIAQSVAHGSIKDSAQVTVAPAAPPAIGLSATTASFADTVGGGAPADQTINVTNSGAGTLSGLAVGTISYGAGGTGWLNASLNSATAPATLTLHVNPASLGAGHYTATVPVTGSSASNNPQNVSVSLDVVAGPAIALSQTAAGFNFTIGGANPADDTVNVTNAGAGSLTGLAVGTITYGTATGWLSASLTTTTAPAKLILHVTPGSLTAGSYTANVPVTSPVASNSPRTVSVTFTVTGVPSIGLSATTATFTDTIAFTNPSDQTIAVTNTGSGALTGLTVGAINYGSGSGWLSGSLNTATAPATLTIHVNPASLAAGHYTATMPIQSGVASNSPQTVAVTLDVVNAPLGSITVTPGWFVMLPTGGQSLVVTAKATNGTTVATPALTWTSRSPSVATVDASGSVTGVAGGTAVIVADAGGGIADSALVAVAGSGQAVASVITDARAFDRVKAGDTVRVLVAVDLRNVSGGNVGSYTAEVDWNAAQLTFVSADTVSGGFMGPTINQNNVGAGRLQFGGANPNGYTGPNVGLLSIKFVAAASGPTPVTLLLTDLTAAGTFTNLLTQAIIASSAVKVQ